MNKCILSCLLLSCLSARCEFFLIRCKYSQRDANQFLRWLEKRLYTMLVKLLYEWESLKLRFWRLLGNCRVADGVLTLINLVLYSLEFSIVCQASRQRLWRWRGLVVITLQFSNAISWLVTHARAPTKPTFLFLNENKTALNRCS